MAWKFWSKEEKTPASFAVASNSEKKENRLFDALEKTPLMEVNTADLQNAGIRVIESKGEIDQGFKSTLQREIGEDHPMNMDVLENAFKKVPIITGGVNKTVDFVAGRGFSITSSDQRSSEMLDMFLKDMNFDTLLRHICRDMLVYGNAYVEIIKTRKGGKSIITGLRPLPPKTMFVRRGKDGTVEGYTQFFKKRMKRIMFEPKEIAHFSWNKLADSPYGLGIIAPLIPILEDKLSLEHDMSVIFSRKANAPYIVYVGNETNPASQANIDAVKNKLVDLRNDQEWVFDGNVKVEVLGSEGKVLDMSKVLDHYENQLIYGMEVPIVLLGKGSVPEGLAVAQLETFERHAESIQQHLEMPIENQILKEYLESQGLPNDVEFNWKAESSKEKMDIAYKLKDILSLSASGVLSDDTRSRIEAKMYDLLELGEVEEVDLPEEPMNPADEERSQPMIPKESSDWILEGTTLDFSTNYTLKEFVGFDFTEYVNDIVNAIKKDSFKTRVLPKIIDPITGEVVRNKVTYSLERINRKKVKEVLIEGFQEGQGINEISNNLKPYVRSVKVEVEGKEPYELTSAIRASLIARTEVIRASSEGQLENYEKNGFNQVRWVAFRDANIDECDLLDGKVFTISESTGMIPLHVNCRCRFLPIRE